jgi:hypothetical protein
MLTAVGSWEKAATSPTAIADAPKEKCGTADWNPVSRRVIIQLDAYEPHKGACA